MFSTFWVPAALALPAPISDVQHTPAAISAERIPRTRIQCLASQVANTYELMTTPIAPVTNTAIRRLAAAGLGA